MWLGTAEALLSSKSSAGTPAVAAPNVWRPLLEHDMYPSRRALRYRGCARRIQDCRIRRHGADPWPSAAPNHAGVHASVGALLRQVLQRALGEQCSDWGACITSDGHDRPGGAVYRDIVANMLGCFLMGLLSTSDSLNLGSQGNNYLAILPQRHMWQPSPPVLLGLKTGLCGSLTTFSSWMLQVGRMLLGGVGVRDQQNPLQAVFCIIFGIQGILHSYQAGAFTARYCAIQYLSKAQQPPVAHRIADASREQGRRQDPGEAGAGPHLVSSMPEKAGATSPNIADGSTSLHNTCKPANASPGTTGLAEATASDHSSFPAAIGTVILGVSSSATLLGLAAFGFSSGHDDWPGIFLAAALAPLGAITRWQMGRWNKLPQSRSWKRLSWLPLGTLAANMVACATGGIIDSTTRTYVDHNVWSMVCKAVIAGIHGSLSTASTWAGEIESMGQRRNTLQALAYSVGSAVFAQFLILAGYGWAVWI